MAEGLLCEHTAKLADTVLKSEAIYHGYKFHISTPKYEEMNTEHGVWPVLTLILLLL